MNDDSDLRARLQAIDPTASTGESAPELPTIAEIQERIMQAVDHSAAPDQSPTNSRSRFLAVAAALLVLAVGTAGFLAMWGGDSAPRSSEPTAMSLALPPAAQMGSCLVFDVDVLADQPVAFAGTVTAVHSDSVTLDVERWYAGGQADRVTVDAPDAQTSVALDGVDFVNGQRYLVTATGGVVSGCGFSGKATPELEQAFAQAFGT